MQQLLNKIIGKIRDQFSDPKALLIKTVRSGLFISWIFFFVVLGVLYVWYEPLGKKNTEIVRHDLASAKISNQAAKNKKVAKQTKVNNHKIVSNTEKHKNEKKLNSNQNKTNADKPIPKKSDIFVKIKQPKVFKASIILDRPKFDKKSVRKMAIIVTDLGLDDDLDRLILSKLPGKVSVAYNANSHELLDKCRKCYGAKKREILLSMPMEPMQYPDVDPGKLTLLTGVSVEQNLAILKKLLHYNPFVRGVIGDYGSHFLAFVDDLAPVIEDLNRREIFFLDPQTCMQSQTVEICKQLGAVCGRVDITMRLPALPSELDKLFASAIKITKETGWVLFVIPASKLIAEKIPEWMSTLRKRKIGLTSVESLLKGLSNLPVKLTKPKKKKI